MTHAPTKVVLVTGASRGVGAEVAQRLADADTHVLVNYRAQADHAEAVATAIRAAGGHASTLAADISDESSAAAMLESIASRFGRLDAVILNASVGTDLASGPGLAIRLNREAQRRLASLAMPLMPVGGRIVFVTSHQAHFFPFKAVPKGYATVAAGKRAGETALYSMRSTFGQAGIHFTVVSGNVSSDASEEFVPAILDAATSPNPQTMVYVGRTNYVAAA
jgi:NAD(P)-dependent dehydrogenase (short-subunit alcohol dehydrogenase family)